MSVIPGTAEAVEQKPERPRILASGGGAARARKWLKWVAIALAAVALLYFVAMNVFLKTRLLRHFLNADPNAVLLDYESGYSYWFGRIHAKNLSLRGKDSNVEWILYVDDVDFTVSLHELCQSRFHATRVRGSGVTFHVRQRVEAADMTPTKLAALPRIPGFEEVPLRDPPLPPLSDADYNLWRVHLDDVIVEHARDIWVDEARFVGDAHIEGGFLLQPARYVEVGPAVVEFANGETWTGSDQIFDAMHGHLGCTIHRFDVPTTHGIEFLKYTDLDTALNTHIPNLTFLHNIVDVNAYGGGGPAHIEVVIDHGLLQRAAIDVESQKAQFAIAEHDILGSAMTRIRSSETGIDFALDATSIELQRRGARDARSVLVRIPEATLRTHGKDQELTKLFPPQSAAVDIPAGALPDIRLFQTYLPKESDAHLLAGKGTFRAHASLEGALAKGEAAVALVGAEMTMKDGHVWGDLNVDAKLPKANIASGDIDLSGTHVELANLRHGQSGKDSRPWAVKAVLAPMHANLGGHGNGNTNANSTVRVNGHFAATSVDARPILDFLASSSPLPSWAGDLISTQGVEVRGDVRTGPELVEIRNIRGAVKDRFELAADYLSHGEHSHTLLLITSGILSAGIESQDGSGHVVLAGTRSWFEGVEASFH